MKSKDIKWGLIVVDPNQEGDMLDILHFVGYLLPPTQDDIDSLRWELSNDGEFGLTHIMGRLEIFPCPENILEEYRKIIREDE